MVFNKHLWNGKRFSPETFLVVRPYRVKSVANAYQFCFRRRQLMWSSNLQYFINVIINIIIIIYLHVYTLQLYNLKDIKVYVDILKDLLQQNLQIYSMFIRRMQSSGFDRCPLTMVLAEVHVFC